MSYQLHAQLQNDCIRIGETPLCDVLLLNDQQFPWLILVPKRENVSEIFQLSAEEQRTLGQETNHIGEKMMEYFAGDKLNIGALGNLVPQLHIHIIVRFADDAAWPKPVWGNYSPSAYSEQELETKVHQIRHLLQTALCSA